MSKTIKKIYLDYAAATPIDKQVKKAIVKNLDFFANAGALHSDGFNVKKIIDECRAMCSEIIGAHNDEIIFTGSGTESNNIAIQGVINAALAQQNKIHVITSTIEHSSVLKTIECFAKRIDITLIKPESDGVINPLSIKNALRENTALVSIQYVNNEIGTIQPIKEIAKVIRKNFRIRGSDAIHSFFHVDASQAPLYLNTAIDDLGVDLMTLDGQKINGPKGVGLLYVRRGVKIMPTLFGGGQERNLRPGTENVPLIVGMAEALKLAQKRRIKEYDRMIVLRNYFNDALRLNWPDIKINGSLINRLPNNINVTFSKISNEYLAFELDAFGISCSTKSTCVDADKRSYVLEAVGSSEGIRFTMGSETNKKQIDSVIKAIIKAHKIQLG